MRRLRLQYDYGNYSTYDYGHITLHYITLHYITGRLKIRLIHDYGIFTELYTTYVKAFTGRFHIRYSFNYDTEYNYIIWLRCIIILHIQVQYDPSLHSIHVILYSIYRKFFYNQRNREKQRGNKEDREKIQEKEMG